MAFVQGVGCAVSGFASGAGIGGIAWERLAVPCPTRTRCECVRDSPAGFSSAAHPARPERTAAAAASLVICLIMFFPSSSFVSCEDRSVFAFVKCSVGVEMPHRPAPASVCTTTRGSRISEKTSTDRPSPTRHPSARPEGRRRETISDARRSFPQIFSFTSLMLIQNVPPVRQTGRFRRGGRVGNARRADAGGRTGPSGASPESGTVTTARGRGS